MYSVYEVADWFLSQSAMTHKKLQKLCYYAQSFCSALFNSRLIKEDFQAWIHGPVCPELYRKYSMYGWNDIPRKDILDVSFDEDSQKILEAVYQAYGDLDGDELEIITHQEDPWLNQREGLRPYDPSHRIISLQDMHDYYLKMYEMAQND